MCVIPKIVVIIQCSLTLFVFRLAKSRQNERTLIHALKNPNSFVVTANNPMLPKDPAVLEQNMLISQNFHMSQVHGVRRKNPDKQLTREWRLTETEDFQRSCILGKMLKTSTHASLHTLDSNFSRQLRRRFLLGRTMSCSKNSRRELRLVSHGPMSLLLRSMDSSSLPVTGKAVPSGSFRKPSEGSLDVVFPVSMRVTISQATKAFDAARPTGYTETISKSISGQTYPPAIGSFVVAESLWMEEEAMPNQVDSKIICRNVPSDPVDAPKTDDVQESKVSGFPSPTKPPDMIVGVDEFRLQSQSDSSANDSDADYESHRSPVMIDETFCLPSPKGDEDSFNVPDDDGTGDVVDIEKYDDLVIEADDEFRLPTPDSSSDEEEDDVDLETGSLHRASLGEEKAANTIRNPERSLSASFSEETTVVKEGECQIPFSESTEHFPSVDMAMSKASISNGDSPQSISLCLKKISRKKRLVIEDTPETPAATDGKENCPYPALLDGMRCVTDLENSVCAICLTNEISEANPLILCDGSKFGVLCNLVVHCRCYSVRLDGLDDDTKWRCDPCDDFFQGGSPSKIQCLVCHGMNGILKRSSDIEWKHLGCLSVLPKQCNPVKRLRHVAFPEPQKHPTTTKIRRRPLVDVAPADKRSPTELALQKKRRRQLVMQRYIDYQAEASDTWDEEEELEVMAIEDEEIDHDFINDSSQLGFTQDDLDRIEPAVDGCDDSATTHRVLDIERERKLQFATPVLNRCMQRKSGGNDEEDEDLLRSSASAPDSVRGLGKMHFIRSVLEHHRNGGSAAEVEDFYKEMEQQAEEESSPVGDEW
jgi:hypothetical protein